MKIILDVKDNKEKSVYLLSIYDKSEQDDISNKELSSLLKLIP